MMAPTEPGKGGAASTDIDTLSKASGGSVTADSVARNGVKAGSECGKHAWTWGELPATGNNNVGDLMVKLGFGKGDIDDHDSWAYLELDAAAEKGATAKAGSDDSIKIWLNGKVVHKNAVDRGASDFLDTFKVDLVSGANRLLVKVSENAGSWSMFVGIEANYNVVAVEPAGKLSTTWASIKNR